MVLPPVLDHGWLPRDTKVVTCPAGRSLGICGQLFVANRHPRQALPRLDQLGQEEMDELRGVGRRRARPCSDRRLDDVDRVAQKKDVSGVQASNRRLVATAAGSWASCRR